MSRIREKIAERTQISLPKKYQLEKVEEKTETEEEEKPEEEPETKVKAEDKTPEIKVEVGEEPKEDENKIEDEDRNIIEIVCPKCKCEFLYDVEKGVIVE